MNKAILFDILEQNRSRTWPVLNKITPENVDFKLNEQTASVGFIYRHLGETMHRLATFMGIPTEVQNTTMGKTDEGQGRDLEANQLLTTEGYTLLENCIKNTPDEAWLDEVETPFFGKVTRVRLFSHILFHTSYHCGQISLTLARGGTIDSAQV